MSDMPEGVRIKRGRLQINYQVEGRRRFEMLPLKPSRTGIEEAVHVREARQRDAKYPRVAEAKKATIPSKRLDAVAQQYLDHVLAARDDDDFKLQLSTRDSYRDALNKYWMPAVGSEPINTIGTDDLVEIDEAIDWQSKKTRKNAITALRSVFAFAMHRKGGKLITSNPASALSTKDAKKSRKPDPDPYTAEERDSVLEWIKANCPQSVHAYYLVAFFSGMRTGELLALKWEKYDGESFTVDTSRVRRQIKGTKTDEPRRVLMPDFVCKVLNALPSRFKRDWLFLNQYGRPYLSAYHLNQYLERAHRTTEVRRREGPYPWRHTYASIGLTNGANPAFLAKQLGHSKAVFFSTYARWIESEGDRHQLDLAVGQKRAPNVPASGTEIATA